LKKTTEKLNLRIEDVNRCMGGLYHNSSKEVHGHDGSNVAIMMNAWVLNERVALATIFSFCNIKYSIVDLDGNKSETETY